MTPQIDLERARRPGRKLRTLLKRFPPHPAPESVHTLRTQTRKLEAMLDALFREDDREAKRLRKALKPVRKAAGRVRDMDVLTAKVLALHMEPAQQDCMGKLVEHMAGLRTRHVRTLARAINRYGKRARKLLKRYLRRLRKESGNAAAAACAVRAGELATELNHWPQLRAANLHAFRIRAKELSYMLQLRKGTDRQELETYGRAKDAAGDWHDWVELQRLAEEMLGAPNEAAVLRKIRRTTREKLRLALRAAQAARDQGEAKAAA